jgi:cytoskeletal protein CcmA (bactofilin family)
MPKAVIILIMLAAAAGAVGRGDFSFKTEVTRADANVVVPADETVKGGLFAAGATVVIDGDVEGDLVAVGADVRINGHVAGNVLACAANVVVAGDIDGNLLARAAVADLPGTVRGNVNTSSASAYLRGTYGGETAVNATAAWLGGDFGKSVALESSFAVLEPGATVAGNVRYWVGDFRPDPAAEVKGQMISIEPPAKDAPRAKKEFHPGTWALVAAWRILALFVFAALVYGVRPPLLTSLADIMKGRPGPTIGVGFALLVGAPLATGLLLLSIVGIPSAIVLAFLYLVVLATAFVFAGVFLGRLLLNVVMKGKPSPVLFAAFVGIVILVLLGSIPYFNTIVNVAVGVFALGALGLYISRVRTLAVDVS